MFRSCLKKVANNAVNGRVSNSLLTQQAASFTVFQVPKKVDTRYLEDDETYEIAPPRIVDNTYVLASNIIERPPLVHPKMPDWEVDYYKYQYAKDSENAKVLPKDLADQLYGKLLDPETFIPEALPIKTEHDINKNYQSIYRSLDQPVYLIVKVKQEIDPKLPEYIWCFPTTEVREGENVRTAAERTVFYHVGEVTTYTLGNAPILHTTYPTVPKPIAEKFPEVKSVKNFLMHSVYLHGKFELEGSDEVVDFAWVTQPELKDFFTDDFTKPLLPLCESSLFYLIPK